MKLKMKTTATLLIAIFLVSTLAVAIPIMALDGHHLETVGAAGTEDRIEIPMPIGTTLGDLVSISWMEYLVAGYPPHVDVILDLNEDTVYGAADDALVFEYAYNTVTHYAVGNIPSGGTIYGAVTGAYYSTFNDDGDGPSVITDTSMAWATKGDPGPPGSSTFHFYSLADWKAGVTYSTDGGTTWKTIDSDSIVLRLEIEIDNWVIDSEAWVQNIDVITSNAVDMTATIEALPPEVVSISVDTTSVDFGTIVQGEDSAVKIVEITNTGDVAVDVTYSIVEDGTFYADNLDVTGVPGTIPYLDSLTANLQLVDVVGFGEYTAVLVFWAEASP